MRPNPRHLRSTHLPLTRCKDEPNRICSKSRSHLCIFEVRIPTYLDPHEEGQSVVVRCRKSIRDPAEVPKQRPDRVAASTPLPPEMRHNQPNAVERSSPPSECRSRQPSRRPSAAAQLAPPAVQDEPQRYASRDC